MSVQFTQQPQQVVQIDVEPRDEDDLQRLSSPGDRAPFDRMTSRLNPYSKVQEQLMQAEVNFSREERAERARIRRIFEKVGFLYKNMTHSHNFFRRKKKLFNWNEISLCEFNNVAIRKG